jgi:cell division protein FtsI (penicillin-binding protein 3)
MAQAPPLRSGLRAPIPRRSRVVAIQPLPTHRLFAVYLLLCLGLGGLAVRLAWLQVIDTANLQSRARAIQTQSREPLGKRRTIVDRTGRLVALDEERFTLWAHPRYFNFPGDDPQKVRKPDEVAARLSNVLAVPPDSLLQTMAGRPSGVKLRRTSILRRPLEFASSASAASTWRPTRSAFIPRAPCSPMWWAS